MPKNTSCPTTLKGEVKIRWAQFSDFFFQNGNVHLKLAANENALMNLWFHSNKPNYTILLLTSQIPHNVLILISSVYF